MTAVSEFSPEITDIQRELASCKSEISQLQYNRERLQIRLNAYYDLHYVETGSFHKDDHNFNSRHEPQPDAF